MSDGRDEAGRTSRTSKRTFSRRRLLEGGAGLGAAAGAVAGISGAVAAAEEADPLEDDPRQVRYQETEHIRAFYRRSRF